MDDLIVRRMYKSICSITEDESLQILFLEAWLKGYDAGVTRNQPTAENMYKLLEYIKGK